MSTRTCMYNNMTFSAWLGTEIAQTMTRALHFNTYGGNPMACAVGSAVIDVSERGRDTYSLSRRHTLSHLYGGIGRVHIF